MSEALKDLIGKVESATGPDPDLWHTILPEIIPVDAPDADRWYGAGICPTESVDEALSLVERKLPGWRWMVDSDGYCGLERPGKPADEMGWDAYTNRLMATPALAILSALLQALQSQEPSP